MAASHASSTREAELQELQELLKSAKTPGVIAILQREIAVRSAPAPEPAPAPAAAVATAVASAASVRHPHDECFGLVSYDHKHTERAPMQSTPTYEHIKWGWDSGTKFVNVYCTVPGLKSSDKDKAEVDFTTTSFDLRVLGVGGKDYRLVKTNLEKDINVDKSKVKVKDGKVVIMLRKVNDYDFWSNLTAKTERRAKAAGGGSGTDGIMDMLGEMYNSGDDNMKRVIGEAWEKSQRSRMAGGGAPDFGGSAFDGPDGLDL